MEIDAYLAINIILVAGALIVSVLAVRTFRQAKILKREERASRRAYLAPSTEPGYLNINERFENGSRLLICLENYGINPIRRANARLMSYNEAEIGDELNDKPNPRFIISFERHNAMPRGSRWVMKLDTEKLGNAGIGDMNLLMSKYLVLNLQYFDPILGKEFSDSFFWSIGADRELTEISNYRQKLGTLAGAESV